MGAWVQQKASWWWPFGAGQWLWTPYVAGSDDPNKPPPSLTGQCVYGPVYHSTNGHTYRTWIAPGSLMMHVDWSEQLDVTGGKPMSGQRV